MAGALLCAVALGCEGSGSPGGIAVQGAHIQVPLRDVDCTDWRKADVRQRIGTVRQLRDFAGGPVGSPSGHGNVLDDERAYDLFQGYCAHYYARGFNLYKLYTRAAAFSSLAH